MLKKVDYPLNLERYQFSSRRRVLASVVIFNANSPLLVMVFEKSEIASLDAKVIAIA